MRDSADNLDKASEIEQQFRELALSAARTTEKKPDEFDGVHCVDCDAEIQKERLELEKFRCVDCQSYKERNGRLYRG